ncbi:ribosomal protein S6 kinase delta-1-like [Haliotis rubra]|uniref:ribosomal protein S6 kinase delta-1-like n=1 Tax=Haliotis rubra TaxID=36100 RepID=UPI001EE50BF1|nr:ribosomal protein S6 kinase delta-1-like [Haliotis rubra]
MATTKVDYIWFFEVSDPQLHPKGFTVYKVTCKVFPISCPECLKETIIWKRYNDFKQLHKAMFNLHKALHRREEFPQFAKPKLFGRFDDTVIEERRQSGLDLLNFIGKQPHLFKSHIFEKFWQGGKTSQGSGGPPAMRPSKLDVISSDATDSNPPPDVVPVMAPGQGSRCSSHSANMSEEAEASSDQSVTLTVNGRKEEARVLEGTWNFPQLPDTISLDSSASFGEAGDTDLDSPLGTSLPDTDISSFDPLASELVGEVEGGMTRSNSWLVKALHTCAQLGEDKDGTRMDDGKEDYTITNMADMEESQELSPGGEDVIFEIGEFDPLRSRGESKVECGKGDIDLSLPSIRTGSVSSTTSSQTSSSARTASASASPAHRSDSTVGSPTKSGSGYASPAHKTSSVSVSPARKSGSLSASPAHHVRSNTPSPARKSRAGTHSSVSSMDLGGKDDYIYLAAHQICLAQEHEANANYEMSFACYKTGVGILLQGVQGDSNKSRRDAVRRKTAQYLMKAEDLYNLHMAQDTADERRWAATDITLSPSLDLDPSLAFIQGSMSELRSYKVLGTVDRVVLVMDRTSDETYVIKTVHKAAVTPTTRMPSILPTSCPYMVSLYKFYETHNAIYLLLQYASGGKLWTHISSFLQNQDTITGGDNSPVGLYPHNSSNVYSGQVCHTEDTDSTAVPTVTPTNMDQKKPAQIAIGPSTSAGRVVHFSNQVTSPDEVDPDTPANDTPASDAPAPDTHASDAPASDAPAGSSNLKPDYLRLSSLSSDEGKSVGDVTVGADCVAAADSSKISLDDGRDFQEVLDQTRPALEQFSINSFDSDAMSRLDSNMSDHIESIPEETGETTEVSDQQGEPHVDTSNSTADDVFGSEDTSRSDRLDSQQDSSPSITEGDLSLDAQRIVQSSKELIKLVDRVLSESGSLDSSALDSADHVTAVGGNTSSNSHESTEPSIYDCHNSNDSDISEAGVGDDKMSSVTPADASGTPTASLTPTSTLPTSTPKRKVSVKRMTSKDLTRSASFECDLKSPTKNRARAMTDLFDELDSRNPETFKLPESCIKTWAAEIVCAISRLHALGVICRDLRPDNVLLGDKGHILLSYFCQMTLIDKQVDPEAVDNLYVAPEVSSITGYSEVCDWWSLGALLYELLTGKSLSSYHPGGINSHTHLHIPNHVSSEGQALLKELLCFDPRERLGSGLDGAEALKAHPFFSCINWNAIENG